tara:strand:- start:99 stop:560 length:462 start_codon:yes stop_codon:yes gene_type:complete
MAIARGAGTEIIRTASFERVGGTGTQKLIIGEQHHIYTVLSVVIYSDVIGALGRLQLWIQAFDGYTGDSAQAINIFQQDRPELYGTFVWNDKFSFAGTEPDWGSPSSGQMTTAAEQNAIADQGSSTSQSLIFESSNDNNFFDITITYIDQNNA